MSVQNPRLDGAARSALLDRMRGRPVTSAEAPQRSYDTSFETLPGFEELKIMRAAGDLLGVANPFYRAHEGCAGATTRIEGQEVINFASYDYLGLNAHPAVRQAAHDAVSRYGTSVSASRLVAGERPFHRELEAALAGLHQQDDAIAFVSGHAANVATIGSLLGAEDVIFHDALIHNSIIVGAELSGARRRSFPHNDFDALEAMLAGERPRSQRALIAVEGLYSMDGDMPDLARLIALKERHGCWLMVDEAHSVGVLGARGHGLAEHAGIDPARVDIWMGTLSKSLASCGGYIAGPQQLIDFLKATAPGFVYSVGLPPAASAAARAALAVMGAESERVARLTANSRLFLAEAQAAGLDTGTAEGHAIVPVMVGDSLKAVMLSERLLARGINVLPIIHPAVPHRSARLRFFISATHETDQIRTAVALVVEEMAECDALMAGLGLTILSAEQAGFMPATARETAP